MKQKYNESNISKIAYYNEDDQVSIRHYLYLYYNYVSYYYRNNIVRGDDCGIIESLRVLLNLEGEEITKKEYDKI